ncbi:cation:proton antiporter [Dietzia maris]|uniref:Cation:proton antiporter n=2 Tax=Dietzia TaxID=37914 RepID=A0A365P6H6_9ACTN|nr:cation:proton antiporter [Dietzia maris]
MTGMEGSMIADLVIGVLALLGSLCFLVAAVTMSRAGDALTRINILSVATGLGMMLFIFSAYGHELRSGYSWAQLLMALVALGATVVVTTVASMTLARAAYRADGRLDPLTAYDDIAEETGT